MKCKIVSKIIQYGKQEWWWNANGNWSVRAHGFFSPADLEPRYGWIPVAECKVPEEVKEAAKS